MIFSLQIVINFFTFYIREAHEYIKHAARNGVPEANQALTDVCERGGCEN